jgi:hypothetical protein
LDQSDFQIALNTIQSEPVPFFSQFSKSSVQKTFNPTGNFQGHSPSNDHVIETTEPYADGIARDHQALRYNCVRPEGYIIHDVIPYSGDEINSVVDDMMQNTLLNVIIEANVGEFSIDNPLCSITKSNLP